MPVHTWKAVTKCLKIAVSVTHVTSGPCLCLWPFCLKDNNVRFSSFLSLNMALILYFFQMIKNLFVVVLLVSVLIVNAEEETQFATITNGRTAYVSQCSDSIQLKPFTIVTSPCPASTSSTVSKVGSTSGTGFGKGFYIGFLSKDPWKDMTEAVAMTCLNAAKGIAYKWIDEIGERIVYKVVSR